MLGRVPRTSIKGLASMIVTQRKQRVVVLLGTFPPTEPWESYAACADCANHCQPCARWNMLLLIHVDACCCRRMQSEHSHLLGFALLGVAACCRLCSSAAMLCGYAVRYGSVWSAVIAHSSRRSTRSFRSRSPRPLLWLQASRSAELVGSRLSPLAAVITMADHHRVTSPITYNSIIL